MITKKLKSKRGFSLSEMMVVLVVISIVGMAIVVGISASAKAHNNITTSSEASILCGTLATEIADDLRFATDVSFGADGALLGYTSRRYGSNVSISSSSGRIFIGNLPVLSENAYTKLDANIVVTYDESGVFNVIINASRSGVHCGDVEFSVSQISD